MKRNHGRCERAFGVGSTDTTEETHEPHFKNGVAQKRWVQNGTLANGEVDQNLRNPKCFILTHSHVCPLSRYIAIRSVNGVSLLRATIFHAMGGLSLSVFLPGSAFQEKLQETGLAEFPLIT